MGIMSRFMIGKRHALLNLRLIIATAFITLKRWCKVFASIVIANIAASPLLSAHPTAYLIAMVLLVVVVLAISHIL